MYGSQGSYGYIRQNWIDIQNGIKFNPSTNVYYNPKTGQYAYRDPVTNVYYGYDIVKNVKLPYSAESFYGTQSCDNCPGVCILGVCSAATR
ncbi:hypothetical protein EV586_101589 [Tumebacillus sp. BK434]|nr:hypothetical protein EV586_101589 [Tumebacillus sp. BK434]